MNQSPLITKQNISIALVWLFHLSGLIGIIYSNAYWFIKATPLNLLLSFILLLINCEWTKKTVFIVVLCFTIGMLAEIVGVEYGFIFGEYSYGNALGTKFLGVPLIIGLNWCILVLMTGFISQFFFDSLLSRTLLGIFLMLSLDIVIEPIAPILDFWTFESGLASFHNYIGWVIIALPLQLVFHKIKLQIEGPFPLHLFILMFLFFTILLLKINSLGI
tara:strand:+ start:587 stop:1240 length:654 start_codon:yes stop_codon:yes gene_type:complete